jgi:nucleoside phosphorylase
LQPENSGQAPDLIVATRAEAAVLWGMRPKVVGMGLASSFIPARAFIGAGFAGACQPALREGDLIVEGDGAGRLAERLDARVGGIATLHRVAEPEEKRRLGIDGAVAVDMETSLLKELAEKAGVPFLAIRSIIDRLDDRALGVGIARRFPRAASRLRWAVALALESWP